MAVDDGFDDPANYPADVRWTWGRHADGIHIWTLIDATRNLTVRGNIIYHVECMGVMVNASTLEGKEYSNWVFENNVFGPTGGEETIHGGAAVRDRFIFRHNADQLHRQQLQHVIGHRFADIAPAPVTSASRPVNRGMGAA